MCFCRKNIYPKDFLCCRKSLLGGHTKQLAGIGGQQRRREQQPRQSKPLSSPVWEEEETDSSPTRRSGSRASRVRARHTELPEAQSPKRFNIVARSRADRKTDVLTEAEVEPLRPAEDYV